MSDDPNGIRERIARVRRRIVEAAGRAGRDPAGITLVAVSKTVSADEILAAYLEGLRDFGENRVQEASVKIPQLKSRDCVARWHLIGHLQSNKARRAVELFDSVQSVDNLQLAERLDRLAAESSRKLPVYLEINLAGEESKSGFDPAQLKAGLPQLSRFEHLDFRGLMLIPPFLDDPEQTRPYFQRAREFMAELNREKLSPAPLADLSMGMSHDFEVAIEEGATQVRVGTAIFGPRPRID